MPDNDESQVTALLERASSSTHLPTPFDVTAVVRGGRRRARRRAASLTGAGLLTVAAVATAVPVLVGPEDSSTIAPPAASSSQEAALTPSEQRDLKGELMAERGRPELTAAMRTALSEAGIDIGSGAVEPRVMFSENVQDWNGWSVDVHYGEGALPVNLRVWLQDRRSPQEFCDPVEGCARTETLPDGSVLERWGGQPEDTSVMDVDDGAREIVGPHQGWARTYPDGRGVSVQAACGFPQPPTEDPVIPDLGTDAAAYCTPPGMDQLRAVAVSDVWADIDPPTL